MRLDSWHLRVLAPLCFFAVGACMAEDPAVDEPPDITPRTTSVYADAVVSIGSGLDVQTCFTGPPGCGDAASPPPGPCADNPALGKNDGVFYTLPQQGFLELIFFCDPIIETGGSNDFKIWGTRENGASPLVEASVDGTSYVVLVPVGDWDNPTFRLFDLPQTYARYVRISNLGGNGTVRIDAIEGLPPVVGP